MRRVVIDPGHGGAVGRGKSSHLGVQGTTGTLEKDVTLDLARRVVRELGGQAVLTRSETQNPTLRERGSMAEADAVFVSIHADDGAGPAVWVHSRAQTGSEELAATIARHLGGASQPHAGDLAVLRSAADVGAGAACLVELGDLRLRSTEGYLSDPTNRDHLATAIAQGIREFAGSSPYDHDGYGRRARSGVPVRALGMVTFASGEALSTTTGATGRDEEHWDPTGGTPLPLLDVSGTARSKALSSNFTAGELTRSGGTNFEVARIDPELVNALQALRDRVGAAVTVTSGYRSWAYNQQLYERRGRPPTHSQHCAGRAADVKVEGLSGLEIAKEALQAYGPTLAIGLGADFCHLDTRGRFASWTYTSYASGPADLAELRQWHAATFGATTQGLGVVPSEEEDTDVGENEAYQRASAAAERGHVLEGMGMGLSAPPLARGLAGFSRDWSSESEETRIRYVMGLLIEQHGYSENAAAGILGNLMAESGVIPNRLEGSSADTPMRSRGFDGAMHDWSADQVMHRDHRAQAGPRLAGVGLAQWTYSTRRRGLFEFEWEGVVLGPDVLFSIDAQVAYIVHELHGSQRATNDVLTSAGVSLEDASDEFAYRFEAPGRVFDANNDKLPRTDPGVITHVFEPRRERARRALRLWRERASASGQGLGWSSSLSSNLVNITHAGPYRLAYDRHTRVGEIGNDRDTRTFRGTAALQDALNLWATHIPQVMNPPAYVLTGGLYVNKPGEHGAGSAVDIDGFWWSDSNKMLAKDAPSDWYTYLTIEASLRKAFGTVLNYDYNADHHDHWHCDLGYPTTWRRAGSQVVFVKRCLNEIWRENLTIDRTWDAAAAAAVTRAGYDLSQPGQWDRFLDDLVRRQSTSP